MVRENASRTERQRRRQQGVSVEATANCEGGALGWWVGPSKPHPDSHSASLLVSDNLLGAQRCLALAWHSQCSRHFARDSQIAVMQLCRTVLTAQVYCANKWSWSCLQHCGPQHQMQRTMHEHQTCMRGQMMAAGCKQAPRMGSTCG